MTQTDIINYLCGLPEPVTIFTVDKAGRFVASKKMLNLGMWVCPLCAHISNIERPACPACNAANKIRPGAVISPQKQRPLPFRQPFKRVKVYFIKNGRTKTYRFVTVEAACKSFPYLFSLQRDGNSFFSRAWLQKYNLL